MSEEENTTQNTQSEKETPQTDQQSNLATSPHQTIIQPQKSKNKMDRLLFRPSMNSPQSDANSQQPRPIIPVSSSLIASQKTKTPRGNSKNNNIINTSVTPLIQTARNQTYNKNSKTDNNNVDNAGSEDEDRDIPPDEFDRRKMTKLRRSVEDTVQALISQEAERKTDPDSTEDNNEDLDNDILSDHDDNKNDDNDVDDENNIDIKNDNNDNDTNDNKNQNDIDEKSGTSGQVNKVSDQTEAEENEEFPNDFENSTKINNNENDKDENENEEKVATDSTKNDNDTDESNIKDSNTEKSGQVDLDKNFLITQVDGAVEGKDNPTPNPNETEETAEQYQKEGINIAYKDTILVPKLDLNIDEENEESQTDKQNKTKKSSKDEPLFTENDVEAAFAEFQKNRTVPPPYMRDATVIYVHAITNEAIEDEDYDLAEKLDKDLKELIAAFNKAYGVNNANVSSQKGTSYSTVDISSTNLQYRLDEVKKQKIIAETEWEERIKALKESEQSKIEEIEARQQKEREEFEEKCQTQEFLQKFTKPSARLLQLWKLQKGLALQHDFEGAKAMKLRAEKLQKQETDEAQQRAIASVKVNYEKLVVKQQRELECAVANGKRKISQMEIEMKKDLENKDKLSKQVETRIKEYRQPLKKSRLPPLNSSQIQSALNQIQIQPLNSGQTPSSNSNMSTPQSESSLSSSSAQRDTTTSALSKRAVASRAKKKRIGNQVEQTAVLDVKIANIRSVLGDKSRNKK